MSGRDQGEERPACLVAASDPIIKPRFVVIVPITHSPPSGDTVGIGVPPRVGQAIDLMTRHAGSPYPGVTSMNGRMAAWHLCRAARVFSYGFIPPSLFAQINGRFPALAEQRRGTPVRR